jgi:hypothetical protein
MKQAVLFLKVLLRLASGDTGRCRWKITGLPGEYTLTISGRGAMKDYNRFSGTPWFAYRHGVKTLILKDGVTGIGKHAFYGCCRLTGIWVEYGNTSCTSVNGVLFGNRRTTLLQCPAEKAGHYAIPDSVTTIGDCAFYGCSRLCSIVIPISVTRIGRSAFYDCNRLVSVVIPNSVTDLGEKAFHGCSLLTSVTLPRYVRRIGALTFSGCRLLSSVVIPDGVTDIGERAFSDCSRLSTVVIPDGVAGIGDDAFYGCSHLASVTIPGSVTSIGAYAFRYCSRLREVCVGWRRPLSIDRSVFDETPLAAVTLRVPRGTKSLYNAACVWKGFKTVIDDAE